MSSVDEAKAAVRAKYPLAYQDYLGHIWSDDLYNCDSNCLQCAIEGPYNTWRQRFDAAWIGAKEHLQ